VVFGPKVLFGRRTGSPSLPVVLPVVHTLVVDGSGQNQAGRAPAHPAIRLVGRRNRRVDRDEGGRPTKACRGIRRDTGSWLALTWPVGRRDAGRGPACGAGNRLLMDFDEIGPHRLGDECLAALGWVIETAVLRCTCSGAYQGPTIYRRRGLAARTRN